MFFSIGRQRSLSVFIVLFFIFFYTSVCVAVSIKNRDSVDHAVSITEDKLQTDHTLKKDEVMEAKCEKGCIVVIDGDNLNPYIVKGYEVTLIDGGLLFVETQERHDKPNNSQSAQPHLEKSP